MLLQELELRAASSEERRIQADREAAERRRQWERLRDNAVISFREDRRAQLLTAQADQWRQTQALTQYVEAMEAHIATLNGDARAAANDWLAGARGSLATKNPLGGELALPPDPEVTPHALQPFMRGHSPYEPTYREGAELDVLMGLERVPHS